MWLLGFTPWLAPLQALALVASPSLGLWHIVVITFSSSFFPFFSNYYCYYVFFFSFVFLIDFFLLLWLFFIFSFFLFLYYYNLFIILFYFPFPSSSIFLKNHIVALVAIAYCIIISYAHHAKNAYTFFLVFFCFGWKQK
jgi:hypothetical protein